MQFKKKTKKHFPSSWIMLFTKPASSPLLLHYTLKAPQSGYCGGEHFLLHWVLNHHCIWHLTVTSLCLAITCHRGESDIRSLFYKRECSHLPSLSVPLKVAGALASQTACAHLQLCWCRSQGGLLEGMVGLLTTSAHARCLPSQQPAKKEKRGFTITKLASPRLQTLTALALQH